MEHLRQDDAVVGIGRQGPRFREIRDQGRLRVRGIDIDDRGLRNLTFAEAGAVPLITHFEDRTSDRPAMLGQEALDVPAVEWRPSVKAVVVAERIERYRLAWHCRILARSGREREQTCRGQEAA